MEQLDLFPIDFIELQHTILKINESHKSVHRALFARISELEHRLVAAEQEVQGINESLLYERHEGHLIHTSHYT